ncbi:TPA: hypothetical protein ACQTZE_004059, partial [Pseudomonas aeruginosa]
FCRSKPPSVLVKSDANDWSSRLQMGGQVHATTHNPFEIPRKAIVCRVFRWVNESGSLDQNHICANRAQPFSSREASISPNFEVFSDLP